MIVNTIRESGGNNAKRFIMVPSYATDCEMSLDYGFKLPKDSVDNRLMLAVHWYPLMATGTKEYTPELKEKIESVCWLGMMVMFMQC